jgi:hypothetical protein
MRRISCTISKLRRMARRIRSSGESSSLPELLEAWPVVAWPVAP